MTLFFALIEIKVFSRCFLASARNSLNGMGAIALPFWKYLFFIACSFALGSRLAFLLLKYWMNTSFVNATVNASIAWWRWSFRFVQSLILPICLPSLSSKYSTRPNALYFSQFNSFITSINCQSSRNLSVTDPLVATTRCEISFNMDKAFLAIYCVLRRSRSIKPSGISCSAIFSLLYFVFDIFPDLNKSSILFK